MDPIDLVILWTIGYLLTFVLFVIVRQHVLNESSTKTNSAPSSSLPVKTSHDGTEASGTAVADGECPACGTPNDAFFTYCKHCLTQLEQDSTSRLALS